MMDPLIERVIPVLMEFTQISACDIDAILLVGSHARGEARTDSDIDLVIISSQWESLLSERKWLHHFGEPLRITQENYGLLTSLRVFYTDKEIEFGLTSPQWLALPLDPGTKEVLEGGYRILYERRGYLSSLQEALPPPFST
ncbi:MAG TPA: nucleotidyltransferase domain-containing protein [Termitinemataceae bacterium]|jgi:hypothetical protein|nr:nucleotidyltransferase domain-containing protein [Termitinemataceae bacterium]